jgi:glycosyltransferase involved in cell wall biosynthesis
MKLSILFSFKDGPWGGGNQFLKALRNEWNVKGLYVDDPALADAVLINSHHQLQDVVRFKRAHPNVPIIHRIDGPIALIRGIDRGVDSMIYDINRFIADGTIFQSKWSEKYNKQLGMGSNAFETTVINAPDPELFYFKERVRGANRKVRLIASSWADNKNKGFDTYQWLDKNLDFSRYEMTFVGNTPVPFKNIKYVSAVNSKKLAGLLREHDIFITASKNDPCSNALLEALHSGLPAIALRDGGHPEIVGRGGELFITKEEIPNLLDKINENSLHYVRQIDVSAISKVADEYQNFMEMILDRMQIGAYQPKKITWWNSRRMIVYYNSKVIISILRYRFLKSLKRFVKRNNY